MSVNTISTPNLATPISRNSFVNQPTLVEEMPSLIARFQRREGEWLTSNCQYIQIGNIHYYGIHKNHQMQPKNKYQSSSVLTTRQLYQELKSHVLKFMKLAPNSKVIQVVGDSAEFSTEGTEKAKIFLKEQLTDDHVVLFGYTGHAKSDGTRCVNASVTDVITEKRMQNQAVANIVGFHTPTALKNWGCSGSNELQHYVIVYGDDETCRERGTVFGDDITTSDFFADSLLMLEGGVQSFRQACNALLLNQKIITLSGLRSHAQLFAQDGTPYFAAVQFLQEVAAITLHKKEPELNLQKWFDDYFGFGKHYIADPKRADYDTKQKLMEDAWNLFMREKLYLKCNAFYPYGGLILKRVSNTNELAGAQRYIITGGPGSGKTSIIEFLEQKGMAAVIHEAACDVIKQELENGVEKPWKKAGFREKIIALQEERQMHALAQNAQQTFFDRSPIDTLTYCLRLKAEPTEILKNAVKKIIDENYYNKTVFLIQNLGFCKRDAIRCESQAESLIMAIELRELYTKLGFRVVNIPAGTLEQRVEAILKEIKKNNRQYL